MRKYLVILLLMLPLMAVAEPLPADSVRSQRVPHEVRRKGWFAYAPYGKSLYADLHPNFARLDVTWITNNAMYDFAATGKSYRCNTLGLFGMDLPIWHSNLTADGRFALSFTLALSANLWMDLFEKHTSPIVDTDYRIGAPTTTFLHRVNRGFLRNYSFAWSPFKHESTHIGDEHQIRRVDQGYALRRVNVSYNYTELVFTVNEPEDRLSQCHTFRAGVMILWSPKSGWYFVDGEAGDGDVAYTHPRLSPWEAYLQYQYQSPTSKRGFQGIASAEVRNRAVYGYDLTLHAGDEDTCPKEYRRFTYNIFLGARYNIPGYDGYFSRVVFGVRAYHGNCPFGMFRSIDNFSQIGACLIFQ